MTIDLAALDAALASANGPRNPGPRDWFAKLPDDLQAVIAKHLARPRSEVSDLELSRLLRAHGIDVSRMQIQHHRNGECECPPRT